VDTEPRRLFTAIIDQECDMYVGLCPELDITSQGSSVEDALANLREAVDLEAADPKEIAKRRRGHVFVTQFTAAHG